MKKKVFLPILIAVVLVSIGARTFWHRGTDALTASGTLEARNISVGSKIGGRISKVLAAEGDKVQPGQVLVTFEDSELSARLLQAQGRYQQAKANYEKLVHGSRPEDIAEAQATGKASESEIFAARATVNRAESDLWNAQQNWERNKKLVAEGVVSQQAADDAEMRYKSAKADLKNAQDAASAAESKSSAAKAAEERTVRGSRAEDIASAKADLLTAEGALKEQQTLWDEREVKSPAVATVEVLDVRPGDLLPANAAIAKLLEADQFFLVVYVPQDQIGRVQVGQQAEVYVDSFPKQAFHAKIEQIRQEAEFLPRNVQTKEEREHQVVGVKLRVDNSENKLRAGISADVRFVEAK
jgi:HlyD family secretion protein